MSKQPTVQRSLALKPPQCAVCGRFISYSDLVSGRAVHTLVEPLSEFGAERFESLCCEHKEIA